MNGGVFQWGPDLNGFESLDHKKRVAMNGGVFQWGPDLNGFESLDHKKELYMKDYRSIWTIKKSCNERWCVSMEAWP